jgi:hypothetical protein
MTGIELTTPTSISMLNSFIIKNADQSFDHYYASMKKRKNASPNTDNAGNSPIHSKVDHPGSQDHSYGKIKGKRPAARDGHTGLIYGGKYFVVFGGDRHHMPFNDTYLLDIKAEITAKSFLF